jgi:hypothetical protein
MRQILLLFYLHRHNSESRHTCYNGRISDGSTVLREWPSRIRMPAIDGMTDIGDLLGRKNADALGILASRISLNKNI